MASVAVREKSSRRGRIYFAAPRDEKNRKVCLITGGNK
jgi:hypothetical protein